MKFSASMHLLGVSGTILLVADVQARRMNSEQKKNDADCELDDLKTTFNEKLEDHEITGEAAANDWAPIGFYLNPVTKINYRRFLVSCNSSEAIKVLRDLIAAEVISSGLKWAVQNTRSF